MELIFQPLLLCKWGPTSSWVCFDLPEIRFTKVSLNFFAALCSRLIMNSLRWYSNKETHYTSANNRCTRVELNHVSFEFPNDQKISRGEKYSKIPSFPLWFILGPFFSSILHKHENLFKLFAKLLSKCLESWNESSGILPRLNAAFQICLHGVNFCFSSHIFNNFS